MAGRELTEEEIMDNDIDPMEAIREIRREEGVAEDDLPERTDIPSSEVLDPEEIAEREQTESDAEELAEVKGDEEAPADNEEPDDETDPDTSETPSEEDEEEEKAPTEKEKAVAELRKFRANGQDFEFSQDEINEQFEVVFGKAMDYTQKMQKIAPYRKMISALEQEGVTQDQLNIAIDALKGDTGAIKKFMEMNKIDPFQLASDDEEATPYTPKAYGKDETALDIEEITSKISKDEEFRITTNVIDEQWDGESRQAIVKNPTIIVGLHNDIKSGIYDQVAPAAMKMKVLDGSAKSDLEYYMLAGQQFQQAMEVQQKSEAGEKTVADLNKDAQDADSKFDKASSEANRKRSAASTGTRADRKGVIDYLDDDDEAYDEWYKRIHSQM